MCVKTISQIGYSATTTTWSRRPARPGTSSPPNQAESPQSAREAGPPSVKDREDWYYSNYGSVFHTAIVRRGLAFAQTYSLLAECRLEDLGNRGGGTIVLDAGPPRRRVERRDAAVVLHGDFRTVIDQILDHARPGPLHRAEPRPLPT